MQLVSSSTRKPLLLSYFINRMIMISFFSYFFLPLSIVFLAEACVRFVIGNFFHAFQWICMSELQRMLFMPSQHYPFFILVAYWLSPCNFLIWLIFNAAEKVSAEEKNYIDLPLAMNSILILNAQFQATNLMNTSIMFNTIFFFKFYVQIDLVFNYTSIDEMTTFSKNWRNINMRNWIY